MKTTVPLAALLLCLLAPAPAAALAESSERDERLIQFVAALEDARVRHHVPGLAVAVVMGDELVLAQGLGAADIEGQRPVTPRTVFAIGSTTKAFTATLATMLDEERRVSLDAPITDYLPEFDLKVDAEDPAAAATLRDALCHRTGFARMGGLWATAAVPQEFMFLTASGAEPVAPFRKEFHYNNVTYAAVGEALGRATGRSWDSLMKRRLLRPLGMRNATLSIGQASRDPNLATGYVWRDDSKTFEPLPTRDLRLIAPAGAVNSTVVDLSRWLRMQLGRGKLGSKRIVSAKAVEATWEPQIKMGPEVAYGLGWMLRHNDGHRVVEHGGGIDGYAAQVTLFPDDDLAYAILMNVTASPIAQQSIGMAVELLLSPTAPEAPADAGEPPPSALDLERLTGSYLANFGPFTDSAFEVSVGGGRLHVNVPGQTNFELKSPDETGKWYFAMTDTVAVSFDESDEGEVVGMKMHQGGMTFELPLEGTQVATEPVSAPAEWNAYLGAFHSAGLGKNVDVLIQNGRLALDVPGQMIYELEPPVEGRWAFRISDTLHVSFERDEDDRVITLKQFRGGQLVESMPRAEKASSRAESTDLAGVLGLIKADARGRAFRALGGIRLEGTLRGHSAGLKGKVTWSFDGKQRQHLLTDLSPFITTTVELNETGGRSSSTLGHGDEALEGAYLAQARAGHFFALFADWRDFFDTVTYLKAGTIDGQATQVVRLQGAGLNPSTLRTSPLVASTCTR